ncbi:MAG TPA: ArsA-related P-loop ATPase [Acidimicrobiales bacterium]
MTHPEPSLAELVQHSSVIVCGGPGGVGKTSVAAALALEAAGAGRRACVVTIDPARRLADALGIETKANVAHVVEGPWSGTLAAMMLDAAGTFDELVTRYASSPDQVQRITANRLYQNLVGNLSGTQEYMATERLFALVESEAFDVIVVDTPPSRHAVDFLSAPRRLSGFLDNRVFRLLVTRSNGSFRAVSAASQLLLRSIAKVTGSEIVDDTIAFFQAFDGMEKGFRDRARAVEELLNAPGTSYVLVTTARTSTIAEATWLADRLGDEHHLIDALIVNRMMPFDLAEFVPPASTGRSDSDFGALLANAVALASLGASEAALVDSASLASKAASLTKVPILDQDVHDVSSLQLLARHLVPGAVL